MESSIEKKADFNFIRYAQCWEDADILLEALNITPKDTVVSIASAGDNSFALLAEGAKKVYAIDLSFSQIACGNLRLAMYDSLDYDDFLAFAGVYKACEHRIDIYSNKLRPRLDGETRKYWDDNLDTISKGFMTAGKFERYFEIFRTKALPLVHNQKRITELILEKALEERIEFYDKVWNNLRWRIMFKVFFSRYLLGHLGRDKMFLQYVDGNVAQGILNRTKQGLTFVDTSNNPYLHWIVYGRYINEFPYALRAENYDKIKNNLNKIQFKKQSLEEFIAEYNGTIDAFNLSDIFEYMTQDAMNKLYEILLQKASPKARLAYWNMLAARKCSQELSEKYGVKTDETVNKDLLLRDKAFFYSRFYLDIVN